MNSYGCCSAQASERQQVESLAVVLKIVAEPNRLRIMCILQKGEHCVCEIMKHVNLSQSLISHHLKDLKDIGVVVDEKRGLRVFYSLTKNGRDITQLLFQIAKKEKEI